MKPKLVLMFYLIITSYTTCLSQFGAGLGPSTYYDDDREAKKAFHNGDYHKAISLWEKYDDIWSLNHLGCVYETMKNYQTALSYYVKSADRGCTHAMLNLARLYYNGIGVNRNYNEALYRFKQAANEGSAIAMYNLGYLYLKGQGTEKNINEALRWYKAAASQGHPNAQKAVEILSKKQYWLIF